MPVEQRLEGTVRITNHGARSGLITTGPNLASVPKFGMAFGPQGTVRGEGQHSDGCEVLRYARPALDGVFVRRHCRGPSCDE